MDRITEIFDAAEAGDLSDEDLGALHTELVDLFVAAKNGEIDGLSATDVETLSKIVDTAELMAVAAKERFDAAEALAMTIAELEARLATVEVSETMTEVEAVEAVQAAAEEVLAEAAAKVEDDEVIAKTETKDEEEKEMVVASAPTLGDIAKAAPVTARPRPSAPAKNFKIVGQSGEIASLKDLAKEMADAWNSGTAGVYGNRVRVARILGEYPEDRILTEMDGSSTEDKIEAVVAAGQDPSSWTDAVVASGGWCAPTEVDYGLIQISEASRPVRDSLPSFQATRGGIRVATSPTLGAIDVSYDASDEDAAISIWDNDTDEDPDGATKGIQTIDCPEFTEYLTQAVVKRLRFGNFGARAFPENVAQFNELALVAHSRVGETVLLDGIKAASTAVTVAQSFGAARDIAEAIKRAAAAYRSRHRAPGVVLRALVPRWVTTLGDVDLMRGLQSDAAFVRDGESIFRAMISGAGVNVTFYDDTPTTGDSQIFGAQAAGALNPFPGTVQWGLYDEGHHLFLDGGALDLGIVRDAALNATNDYETFVETFEGLAHRGVESLWITSTVCPDGTSSAGIDASGLCAS
jgi:hypothetical protein